MSGDSPVVERSRRLGLVLSVVRILLLHRWHVAAVQSGEQRRAAFEEHRAHDDLSSSTRS